jgi:4-carboxymuconolactone decarboxylase
MADMSRLPDMPYDSLSDEQKRVYDQIKDGPRGNVVGPYLAWLLRPEFAARAEAFGIYPHFMSSLPDRQRIVATLVNAQHWQARHQWMIYSEEAKKAGIDDAAIGAIRDGKLPIFDSLAEAHVYNLCREILTMRAVADSTFEAAKAEIGLEGIVEIIALLGYYGLTAMTQRVFNMEPPD